MQIHEEANFLGACCLTTVKDVIESSDGYAKLWLWSKIFMFEEF